MHYISFCRKWKEPQKSQVASGIPTALQLVVLGVRLNANATESYTTERKCNQTESNAMKWETKETLRERSSMQVQQNANRNGIEHKWNKGISLVLFSLL